MMQISKSSLLGRWYLFCRGRSHHYEDETDICTFRRVCFVTGPLKWLAVATVPLVLLGLAVVAIMQSGWGAVFIPIATITVLFALAMGLSWCFIHTIKFIQTSDIIQVSYKSWRDKHCSKVELVD